MNNTEFDYSKNLEMRKKVGDIEDYSFECTKLKIGDDCWYTPDFRVIRKEMMDDAGFYEVIEFHEVKGTTKKRQSKGVVAKPFIEDDAMVKIKAAAATHPFKFILTWKGLNGQWEYREIN